MNREEILKHVDHTLLAQGATWKEIKEICDDAVKYGTASVCIPPSFVKEVSGYFESVREGATERLQAGAVGVTNGSDVSDNEKTGMPAVCTVIGFPNGYMTTATKVYETEDAIRNGADEIDMVINIGWAKAGLWDKVTEEIKALKKACGEKILKVIIETCLLTDEEKIMLCKAVTEARADYIKTSTGFAGGGATFEDVRLFKENVGTDVKIKAAGGISSFEDAEKFLELGADRLGTSRLVKILKADVPNIGE